MKKIVLVLMIALNAQTSAFAQGDLASVRNLVPADLNLGRDVIFSTGAAASYVTAMTIVADASVVGTTLVASLVMTALAVEEYAERNPRGDKNEPANNNNLREQIALSQGDAKTFLATGEMSPKLKEVVDTIRALNKNAGVTQIDSVTDAEICQSIITTVTAAN